jgi:hypothetical protein
LDWHAKVVAEEAEDIHHTKVFDTEGPVDKAQVALHNNYLLLLLLLHF